MLMKFVFRRVFPAITLYYFTIQAYVMYNAFYGEPRQISVQPIDVLALPDTIQTTRGEIIQDMLGYYHAHLEWRHAHPNIIIQDPLTTVIGIEWATHHVRFWQVYMGIRDIKSTLKSVVHYNSSIRLDLELRSITRFGRMDMDVATWLELENQDNILKITRSTEEWYGISHITQENMLFPIGLSAEIIRSMHAKIIFLFPL